MATLSGGIGNVPDVGQGETYTAAGVEHGSGGPTPIPTPMKRVRLRRFVVADRSMEPTLVAGQGLVAVTAHRPRSGRLYCVEHPDRPGFWLVKRAGRIRSDGTFDVISDNAAVPTVDSRAFGPVAVDRAFRVLFAVPRRLM